MKTTTIKNTTYETKYEAYDGTLFSNKEECLKYENTAIGVATQKLQKLFVGKEQDAWSFMCGCDDNKVIAVKMTSQQDFDTVLQWLFLNSPYLLDKGSEKSKEDMVGKIEKAFALDDILLLGQNYDGEYYMMDCRKSIVERLNNIENTEDTEE